MKCKPMIKLNHKYLKHFIVLSKWQLKPRNLKKEKYEKTGRFDIGNAFCSFFVKLSFNMVL